MGRKERTTDKAVPGAQTRPAEAENTRATGGADSASDAPGDAPTSDPADETDQSQGGGNPHVPIAPEARAPEPETKANKKPTKAEPDKHDRDHEVVRVRVLRPIVENGLHHPVDAFFDVTRARAAALGGDVRIEG